VRLAVLACSAIGASACATGRGASSGGGAGGEAYVTSIVFPLASDSVRFAGGFGDAREGHAHRGQDLFCARWTPILAAVDGTVDWMTDGRPRGTQGYALLLRGSDGNLYYYAHLNDDDPGTNDGRGGARYAYARGLRNGDRVAAGDVLGYAGDSGNAERAGAHLHFELHRGKWGAAVDPAPTLRAAWARRRAPTP
jgi:murein DD-endopeptidase MepM/ murein hydrolase activator NlpD